MAAAVRLRHDFDADRLRALARGSKDGPQARRLLALAAIYEGAARSEAARIGGVTLQIVRDWVLRFNADGPEGLWRSTFDPQLIAKYQRRFPGFDEKIISMYARGMSVREIFGHLRDLYGVDVPPCAGCRRDRGF